MNIWQLFPSVSSYLAAKSPVTTGAPSISGPVFEYKGSPFTRKHNIKQIVEDLSSVEVLNKGIWLKSHLANESELLLSMPIFREHLAIVLIDREMKEKTKLASDAQIFTELRNVYVQIAGKSDSRTFERHFRDLRDLGAKGIGMDIESLSRGQIALAHKFDLEVIVTGIKHERHEQAALNSGADHFMTVG